MKVSYFETARYRAPGKLPPEWPVPPAVYDFAAGSEAYRGMVERAQHVERLGFDWVSVSEHHYSPRRSDARPDCRCLAPGGASAEDKDRRARPDRLAG